MKRTALKRTPLKRTGFKRKLRKLRKPLKKKKTKASPIKKLKNKADEVFSEYIRKRDKGTCYTCGRQKYWKQMQAGHYIKRSCQILRYDEKNAHCQDARCNIFMSGNYPAYALNLLQDYGQERLDYLDRKSKILKQWKPWELEDIIHYYQEKIKKIDEKK